jgi:hypothetical protein
VGSAAASGALVGSAAAGAAVAGAAAAWVGSAAAGAAGATGAGVAAGAHAVRSIDNTIVNARIRKTLFFIFYSYSFSSITVNSLYYRRETTSRFSSHAPPLFRKVLQILTSASYINGFSIFINPSLFYMKSALKYI